jgi:hypothetical protein
MPPSLASEGARALWLRVLWAEDPSRMVPALDLTNEEVVEHLQKILKGVSVIPHMVPKYHADNPPPATSCFSSCEYFSLYFFALLDMCSF